MKKINCPSGVQDANSKPEHEKPIDFVNSWQEVAPRLTAEIYQHMFKRAPDAGGLAFYSARIANEKSILPSLQSMAASDEYRSKQASDQAPPDGIVGLVDQAVRIAARYGKRNLSLPEVVSLLGPEMRLGAVHRRLFNPRALDWSNKKVLLFGAFGNGNMGDAYQAVAMRLHIHRYMGVPLDSIFACSVINQADYPFPRSHKIPPDSVLNTNTLNTFDLMVVGGGGLLAHPHDPLLTAEWVAGLTLPVILVGVGAGTALSERFRPLANLAMAVSGRDQSSLEAFRASGISADLVPDPIASITTPGELMAFDPPRQETPAEQYDWLWLIKYAANVNEQAYLNEIRRQIDQRPKERHCVVAIEPSMDHTLNTQFPEVRQLSSLNRLWPLLQASKRVCSMRFHGAIFSLLQNKPVVGCAQIKLKTLAEQWGASLAYADSTIGLNTSLANCRITNAPVFRAEALQVKIRAFLERVSQ